MEKEYRNVGYVLLALVVLGFFGFYRTYFGLFPQFNEQTNALVHFHAFVLSLWVVLLIVQPLLIRYKKNYVHRLLGKSTYLLFPIIVCTLVLMTMRAFHRNALHDMSVTNNLKELLPPIALLFYLIIFYSLAILHRKNTPVHMRYMISTAVILIDPTLTRISDLWFHLHFITAFSITFVVMDIILAGLIFMDKRNGRNYKPYVVAFFFVLVYEITFYVMNG